MLIKSKQVIIVYNKLWIFLSSFNLELQLKDTESGITNK